MHYACDTVEYLAAEYPSLKRHTGDNTNLLLLRNGKQGFLQVLVENIIDDLQSIQFSGFNCHNSILRFSSETP